MIYDMSYYTQRLHCTPEEKRECLETVRLIVESFYFVRQNGMLSLEERLSVEIDDPFFQDGAHYVVAYGYHSPEQLGRTFDRMLMAGDYRGKELLHNILIAEGLPVILSADWARLEPELAPWFGAGWWQTVADIVRQGAFLRHLDTSICPEFDHLLDLPLDQRDALTKKIWESSRSSSASSSDLLLALECAGGPVRDFLMEGLTHDKWSQVGVLHGIYIPNRVEVSRQAQNRVLQQLYTENPDICTPRINL